MARFFTRRDAGLGKKPGEMVYIGKKADSETKIDLIEFNESFCEKRSSIEIDDIKNIKSNSVCWINVEGLSDSRPIDRLKEAFGFSSLIAADIMNTGTRSRFQLLDNGFFLCLKMLDHDTNLDKIVSEHLSLIVADNNILTFQEAAGDVFDGIRLRLDDKNSRIRNKGADYCMYSLVDSVVDNYISILQNIADKIEGVEEQLLEDPDEGILKQILYLKKEIIYLGKIIKPVTDSIKHLIRDAVDYIGGNIDFYNDLFSNLTHISETIDIYKELLTQQQSNYDTYANNRLNEKMKFLTVFSVIFLPLTLITGIYGTNFDFIPELHFKYGYIYLWGVLVIFALIMIVVFKRRKWF